MRNQKGEVMTGIMVVMMIVMMFTGGMHRMHGGHRPEGAHQQIEQKIDHDEDGAQRTQNQAGGQDFIPVQGEADKR